MKTFAPVLATLLLIAHAPAQTPVEPAKTTHPETPIPADPAKPAKVAIAPVKRARLKYTPPKSAVSGTRIDGDGGSRAGGVKLPSLYVLAPNHTGLTTREQPSLFWYQSGPATTRFELTVIEPKKPKPVLRVGTDQADQPGIHRIPLAKHGISLTPGVLYKWTIALVPDPANRSQDVIASGTIQRIEPDAPLTAALADAAGGDKAAIYADKGIWYDALDAITNEIDASPKNKELRLQRAALLEQAGLKDAAAAERR